LAGRTKRSSCDCAATVLCPELNPVEAIWVCLKKHEIANLCLDTIGKVGEFVRNRFKSYVATANADYRVLQTD